MVTRTAPLLIISCLIAALQTALAEPSLSSQYVAMARQGDVTAGAALFHRKSPSSPTPSLDRELAQRFHRRFVTRSDAQPPDVVNPFIQDLVIAYRTYWAQSMMGELPPAPGRLKLQDKIKNILFDHSLMRYSENHSDVWAKLDRAIATAGFFHDRALASPWLDLVVWREQRRERLEIALTDQVLEVDVVRMDDFISLGWIEFATLGMTSTGGWAAPDAIYCVSEAWDPQSESYRVSFLQHEARHVADFRRFPGLPAHELEYRAKLTELAFADVTLPRLLKNFGTNGSPNIDSPHAYANFRVMNDLQRSVEPDRRISVSRPWTRRDSTRVNQAAAQLIAEHTLSLQTAADDAVGPVVRGGE